MARIALFFLLLYLAAFLGFWLLGMLYGIVRRPAVYFPARLAATMAAGGLVGAIAGGLGGIVLSTFIMDRAFARREDYRTVPVVIAGAVLSTIVLAGTLWSAYILAWQVFE